MVTEQNAGMAELKLLVYYLKKQKMYAGLQSWMSVWKYLLSFDSDNNLNQ